MNQKQKRISSKKARDSARGENCTLNIAGVCNYDTTTTILAHLPDDSGTGKTAGKSDDVGCAVYACSNCHNAIDRRSEWFDVRIGDIGARSFNFEEQYYMLRALKRTIRRMIENKTITIGG